MGKLQRVKKLMSSVKAKQGLLLVVILSFVLSLSLSLAPLPKVFRDVFYIGMNGVAYGIELDATCDGDNDDIQVQGILTDNVPAGGGEIVLLAGAYDFHVTVTRAINNVKISGSGKATSITTVGVTAPFTCTGQTSWTFEAFACDDAPAYTKTNGVTASTIVNGIWVNSVFTVDLPSPERPVRSVTLVVAASDSGDQEKAAADFVCDGTSDQVEIQAAIDAIPEDSGDIGGSGEIRLTAGTFWVTDPIMIENVANDSGKDWLTISGAGRHSTLIKVSGAFDATDNGIIYAPHMDTEADMAQWCEFRDFGIFGTHATAVNGSGFYGYFRRGTFENILIGECAGHGMYLMGEPAAGESVSGAKILNSYIYSNELDGIFLESACDVWISDVGTNGNRNNIVVNTSGVQINHVHFSASDNNGLVLAYSKDISRTIVHGCYFDSAGDDEVSCGAFGVYYTTFEGNTLWRASGYGSAGDALFDAGTASSFEYSIIAGNVFDDQGSGSYGLDFGTLAAGAHEFNTVTNNVFMRNGVADIRDTYPSRSTIYNGNVGDVTTAILNSNPPEVRQYASMQNKSADNLTAGSVVVMKATSGMHGYEFTTTTTVGDPKVWGVLAEDTVVDAWGDVQITGWTTTLKVNGTIDIAIGDYIGTYSTVGIGMKAYPGDTYYAIAYEAYATDDSSGVIDALITGPMVYDVARTFTELTISADAVTILYRNHTVDTEGNAATDNVATISGGVPGMTVVLRAENDARTVVVQHNIGNIWLHEKADISLDDVGDSILLIWDGTRWSQPY